MHSSKRLQVQLRASSGGRLGVLNIEFPNLVISRWRAVAEPSAPSALPMASRDSPGLSALKLVYCVVAADELPNLPSAKGKLQVLGTYAVMRSLFP